MNITDRARSLGFRLSRNNLIWGFIAYDENWDELFRVRYVAEKIIITVRNTQKTLYHG